MVAVNGRDSDVRLQHNAAKARQKLRVNQAIRRTREAITSDSGTSKQFDMELLIVHARNWRGAKWLILSLVTIVAVISTAWVEPKVIAYWAVAALIGQFIIISTNMKFLTLHKNKELKDLHKWQRQFVAGDLLNGLIWASLIAVLGRIDNLSFLIFQFASIVVVLALYSFIAAPIRKGMAFTTLPVSISVALFYANSAETHHMVMIITTVLTQLLFSSLSSQIRNLTRSTLAMKAEKDDLILELEQAKGISDESRRRAEEANLAKSKFLATMSHELRTPLNAILGFSEVMKGELLGPIGNETYKEYVGDIHGSGKHLLNLINEILDLSRIEAGKYELNEEPVHLASIADDCVNLIELRAENKGVSIDLRLEQDMPRLWADERALRQVILNLLSNAVKFTPKGGEIVLRVGWMSGGGQYVSVTDNGPGIPEEEIPIVLSQFGQGSIATKSAEQGTGLGLPIVQALVHTHGGSFDFRSQLRVGTSVTTSFPAERVMQALEPVQPSDKKEEAQPEPRKVSLRRKTA